MGKRLEKLRLHQERRKVETFVRNSDAWRLRLERLRGKIYGLCEHSVSNRGKPFQ
jgi:hypothetical protein